MSLDRKDIERLERIVLKSSGDIAECIGRSLERLEERIDGAEARIHSRLSELDARGEPVVSGVSAEPF